MRTASVWFDGFWSEDEFSEIPRSSGIYCVYATLSTDDIGEPNLMNFLYVGQAANIRDRVKKHDRLDDWKSVAENIGVDEIVLAVGDVNTTRKRSKSDQTELDIVERAIIHRYLQPCNREAPWLSQNVRISMDGEIGLLHPQIEVSQRMGFFYSFDI